MSKSCKYLSSIGQQEPFYTKATLLGSAWKQFQQVRKICSSAKIHKNLFIKHDFLTNIFWFISKGSRTIQKLKGTWTLIHIPLLCYLTFAEDEGFKPPIPIMGIPDFESSAFGHSANLPFTTCIRRSHASAALSF